MDLRRTILVFLSFLPAALPAPAATVRAEHLEYDITWVGVSVGTMSVRSEPGGAP